MSPSGFNKNLLVVDDDEAPRKALQYIFRPHFDVTLATSGTQAVTLAKENEFPVTILDIRMPGISGIETLQRLKKLNPMGEVIMLTGYQSLETALEAFEYGASNYLLKPFQNTRMEDAVRKSHARYLSLKQGDEYYNKRLLRKQRDLITLLSHEFRTPLNGLLGFIDILKSTNLSEEQIDYLNIIAGSGNEINRKIEDVLLAANLQTDYELSKPKKFNPFFLVQSVVDEFSPLPNPISVRFSQTAAVPPLVYGRSEECAVILHRLFDNAIKFTEKGTITIEIDFIPKSKSLGSLNYTVVDQGPGTPLSVSDQKSMYQPFVKFRESHEPFYKGIGLGLAICEMLSGKIGSGLQSRNRLEGGAEFSFDTYVTLASEIEEDMS